MTMGTLSKNFDWREFEKSDVATRYHIQNNITTFEVRDSIKALVDNVLQPLREAWGAPLIINSGYRSPELNAHVLVGGAPTSQHVKGEAADVSCKDPLKLARLAVKLGLPYDQLIVYPTFVHFSHKLDGEQRGQILYSKNYTGKRL
jgi:uncharacterized protein YcbK (DUF882 family)